MFTRWRNSHGFGVHSPFGFQLVERVIKRQRGYAYYAEEDIDRCCLLKHSRGNLAKGARMLLRLACMLKFESAFLRPDAHPAFHAALKGANSRIRIVDNPPDSLSCDMIASRRDSIPLDSLSAFISMEGKTILLKDFPEGWFKSSEKLLTDFANFLLLERGLSTHTLEGYHTDVTHLFEFLDSSNIPISDTDTDTLHQFLCTLHDIGISARSQARILSGIRAFFKFLRLEGYIEHDPCELLEAPRFGRTLPDVLSVEEIDSMIGALDPSKDESPRNHAIIETLYGSGIRVSELVELSCHYWQRQQTASCALVSRIHKAHKGISPYTGKIEHKT